MEIFCRIKIEFELTTEKNSIKKILMTNETLLKYLYWHLSFSLFLFLFLFFFFFFVLSVSLSLCLSLRLSVSLSFSLSLLSGICRDVLSERLDLFLNLISIN